jgi:hypothetical protein
MKMTVEDRDTMVADPPAGGITTIRNQRVQRPIGALRNHNFT